DQDCFIHDCAHQDVPLKKREAPRGGRGASMIYRTRRSSPTRLHVTTYIDQVRTRNSSRPRAFFGQEVPGRVHRRRSRVVCANAWSKRIRLPSRLQYVYRAGAISQGCRGPSSGEYTGTKPWSSNDTAK